MKKKIGIMGGSFDPIHMGHLMMSEYVRSELDLDEVLFMPTGNPPHKQIGILEAEKRLEMVKIAIADNPHFTVSDLEVQKKGISYSVDTVLELKALHPEDEFYFLIGSDLLPQLKSWKRFDELATEIEFVLSIRPGFDTITKEDMVHEIADLKEDYGARVTVIETPLYEISSTQIRQRIRDHRSVRYLVKQEVISKIEEAGYYRK